MKQELNECIKPEKEEIEFLRFGWDKIGGKISIEGRNVKYDIDGNVIDSQPIRLIFREQQYNEVIDFLLLNDIANKIINMLLRKLEIDRNLADESLCKPLPENVPPYKVVEKKLSDKSLSGPPPANP